MPASFTAEIYLFSTTDSGRQGPLPLGEWRTILRVGEENWSARLAYAGSPNPGERFVAIVRLLAPEASQFFPLGTEFTVLERGNKGAGRVESIVPEE